MTALDFLNATESSQYEIQQDNNSDLRVEAKSSMPAKPGPHKTVKS